MNYWKIFYEDWKPEQQGLRESLCALGNGYFVTRGAAEEVPDNDYNYPGTYLACGYNRLKTNIGGKTIENEDLVNWPNWLFQTFRHEDGEWLDLEKVKILDYEQELDLYKGLLSRKFRFMDAKNRETSVITKRLVSMYDMHVAAMEWTIIPENWSGKIIVRSGIDGNVINNGVPRYRDLNSHHLDIIDTGFLNDKTSYIISKTKQSRIEMAQAAKVDVYMDKLLQEVNRNNIDENNFVGQDITIECNKLEPVMIEKTVSLYTSKDFAISDILNEAKKKLLQVSNFNGILDNHAGEWKSIWKRNNIEVKPSDENLKILRLHIFHVFQSLSHNSIDHDIGVPSRGWHGEAYRGHIFWDELYILPYLNLHLPQLARTLLMYRYRRMDKARRAAEKAGYKGTMFPWQSGSNGREETQVIHLNPKSGNWLPDNSQLQRHITAAIIYNVWQYYQATNDMEFLYYFGAEMIINAALFWSTIAEYNPIRDRYEIKGVMGPDEYHTGYPGSDKPGINNNAYTNFMASWVIDCAQKVMTMLDDSYIQQISKKVGLTKKDIERWNEVKKKMFIPFIDGNIIEQFEGFSELKDFDWEKYRKKYGKVMRLDRILEKENDSPNNYKASKQADALMLFYLFSSEELVKVFNQLGYEFKPPDIPANVEYYRKITSHGSTLSQVIHSWVHARNRRKLSWENFELALMSDFKDVQGGTTPEGIHLGAMAGTVDLIQRCYTGLEVRDNVLWLNPKLPGNIEELTFNLRFRSHWMRVFINDEKIIVNFERGWAEPVRLGIGEKIMRFEKNTIKEIKL